MKDILFQTALQRFTDLDRLMQEAATHMGEWRRLREWLVNTSELFPEEFQEEAQQLVQSRQLDESIRTAKFLLQTPGPEIPEHHEKGQAAIEPKKKKPVEPKPDLLGMTAARQRNDAAAAGAQRIIASRGPMKLDDLMKTMMALGWRGFGGTPQEDYRDLYRVLQARRKVFRLYGRSLWGLQEGPTPRAEQLEEEQV